MKQVTIRKVMNGFIITVSITHGDLPDTTEEYIAERSYVLSTIIEDIFKDDKDQENA